MEVVVSTQCSAEVDSLVRNNMGLAYYQLKKWGRSADVEAQSAALEGLWKAARSYDASKNVAFSTYASVCIYNAIGMYMRGVKRIKDHEVTSLDEPIRGADKVTFADTLAAEGTPESAYIEAEVLESMRKAYAKVLEKTKSDKHKIVMEMWYASGGTTSQKDMADASGLSQPYVSRIIAATKHKIRQEMEAYL